ncbi:hypothetical protein AURDEDRAFT_172228 [Auricularia subglabra TFB-10046 SS5]|nr:hypothetical protein AURDEDRAFT_172228 [Auricularia subglabra TFB-10046 SS5]
MLGSPRRSKEHAPRRSSSAEPQRPTVAALHDPPSSGQVSQYDIFAARPPPLDYTAGVLPLLLFFALCWRAHLSITANLAIITSLIGAVSGMKVSTRQWYLWLGKGHHTRRPIGAGRWGMDIFQIVLTMCMASFFIPLIIGSSNTWKPTHSRSLPCTMRVLTLPMFLTGLFPDKLMVPFRVSSLPPLRPLPPFAYFYVEDVDGGGCTEFRQAWRVRYEESLPMTPPLGRGVLRGEQIDSPMVGGSTETLLPGQRGSLTNVLLRIFHLLRTHAKFGEEVRGMDTFNRGHFSARKDLAAARLVCLAWLDSATEALYTDVDLHRRRACIAFANTLLAHPPLARLVRRVTFPRSESDTIFAFEDYAGGFREELALRLAIEHVVRLCDRAEDFRFFRHSKEVEDVSGILQCAPRAVHLSLRDSRTYKDFYRVLPFAPGSLAVFPHLQTLTIIDQSLDPLILVPLQTLHTLRLSACSFDLAAFHTLLARLPKLRNIVWRANSAGDIHTVEEVFGPSYASLKLSELTLVPQKWKNKELALGGLHLFSALRSLTISAPMLSSMQVPPPALAQLTVTFAPSNSYLFDEKESWRRDIMNVADCLVHRAAGWREMWSPDLASIAIWDVVCRRQLMYWGVVSYILRESLLPCGFDVSVNLV